jgi:CheY-like chemotaxis protein
MSSALKQSKPQVLVVDDVVTNRALLRAILVPLGYEVIEAENGLECCKLCQIRAPEMVLLDITMPVMDGISACYELRRHYDSEALPIVLVTALSESDDVARGLKAGANDYVTKPVDRTVLLARIENQLAIKRERKLNQELAAKVHRHERMRTVGLLAVGVAHNFNNLLGGMMGAVDLLARQVGDDQKGQRCIKVLRQSLERGGMLTKKLAIASGARPRQHAEFSNPQDLSAVIKNVVEVQREVFGSRVQFNLEMPEVLPAVALSEQSLGIVFASIVSNAAESILADKLGVVDITDSNACSSLGEPIFQAKITDTGIGMDAETRRHIFEPFFSTKNLDVVNNVSMKGDGLGMWYVYNLVYESGGEVEVDSEPGKGTSVLIRLPALDLSGPVAVG